ncbi:MAG: iron-containing alcohol dehydrogenase [Bacillota bacterium]
MHSPLLQDFRKSFIFSVPTKIIFGIGTIDKIAEEIMELKIAKPLIVTDQGIVSSGLLEILEGILKGNNINYEIFSQVKSNPTSQTITKGTHKYLNSLCNGLIALGGGSTIDAAKAIGIQARHNKPVCYFSGINKVEKETPPLIAIPTTVGTGAEISFQAILLNNNTNCKIVISSPKIAPDAAIYDPQLLATLPISVAAATGIDSLARAIESYVSKEATLLTDVINIEAIRLTGSSLRQFVADPSNLDYGVKIQLASILSAVGSINSENGIVSSMAKPLEGYLNIHHGIACGVMLPHVMQWNLIANPDKYALIAELLGEEVSGFSVIDRSAKAVSSVQKLVYDIGLPTTLTEIGFKYELIEDMAQDIINSYNANSNPRRTTKEDIINLYNQAI